MYLYHSELYYRTLIEEVVRYINLQNYQRETPFTGQLIQFPWCLMFCMSPQLSMDTSCRWAHTQTNKQYISYYNAFMSVNRRLNFFLDDLNKDRKWGQLYVFRWLSLVTIQPIYRSLAWYLKHVKIKRHNHFVNFNFPFSKFGGSWCQRLPNNIFYGNARSFQNLLKFWTL